MWLREAAKVQSLALRPTEDMLAYAHHSDRAEVVALPSGAPLCTIGPLGGYIEKSAGRFAFSPDGRFLGVGGGFGIAWMNIGRIVSVIMPTFDVLPLDYLGGAPGQKVAL